jgi:magnesium transporter
MPAMDDHLITVDGQMHEPNVDTVKRLLDSSTRFWLDLTAPSQEDQDALLRDTFKFHPLALEDAAHFGQRPKIDSYDDFTLMVVFGLNPAGRLVEVHCFYTDTYLVTVHQDHCPAMLELAERLAARGGGADHVMVLYRVIDHLVDGYFPLLGAMDDHIDELEDQILVRPTEQQLGTLFDLKRQLISLRKVVTPQRDMFASLLTDPESLPGMTNDAERYFRDLYDHLIRISDLVDSYRDLLSGALDTHLSTVSNRLNGVMKQLTIIATVFLPATFLTGFFGQNFGWMVNHLSSLGAFLGLGLALQVALAVVLLMLFRQRGWLSANAVVPSPEAGRSSGRRPINPDHRWRMVHPGGLVADNGAPPLASTAGTATAGTASPRSHP